MSRPSCDADGGGRERESERERGSEGEIQRETEGDIARQSKTGHDRDSARTVSAVHANQKVCCNKYSIYV